MDAVRQLEVDVLRRHKFMNAVIEDYDSPIQQLFCGATIFITGGGGFLGKHIIEKLFRSCKIKRIFVLLRPKKDKLAQERLDFIIKDPVYDLLREKQPNFASLLEVVEGDVSEIQLGLSTTDYAKIIEEVDFIFHMAATIRFDGALRTATLTNVRGTRECLALAKDCKKLKCFTYVSTAFTHATLDRIGTELKEQFYPCPIPPNVIIEMAENFESKTLEDMTEELIRGWPNTYTFTKAIAEEEVRINSGDLPVCIVRPPFVLPACYEPSPGWTDLSSLYGPVGILVGAGLGVLHVFPVNSGKRLNVVPVDYVNNSIIAATWDACERKTKSELKEIPIYAISSTKRGIVWESFSATIRTDDSKKLASPLAIWYCSMLEVTNPLLYWMATCILHYIPAYLAHIVCKILGVKIKEIPSFPKLYQKYYKISKVFSYFMDNEWYFSDDNLTDMICRMSGKDRDIFNCDIFTIDYGLLVKIIGLGLRKYIVKDGLKDSDKAYRKQKWLFFAHILYLALNACVIFYILYFCFAGIKNILL